MFSRGFMGPNIGIGGSDYWDELSRAIHAHQLADIAEDQERKKREEAVARALGLLPAYQAGDQRAQMELAMMGLAPRPISPTEQDALALAQARFALEQARQATQARHIEDIRQRASRENEFRQGLFDWRKQQAEEKAAAREKAQKAWEEHAENVRQREEEAQKLRREEFEWRKQQAEKKAAAKQEPQETKPDVVPGLEGLAAGKQEALGFEGLGFEGPGRGAVETILSGGGKSDFVARIRAETERILTLPLEQQSEEMERLAILADTGNAEAKAVMRRLQKMREKTPGQIAEQVEGVLAAYNSMSPEDQNRLYYSAQVHAEAGDKEARILLKVLDKLRAEQEKREKLPK